MQHENTTSTPKFVHTVENKIQIANILFDLLSGFTVLDSVSPTTPIPTPTPTTEQPQQIGFGKSGEPIVTTGSTNSFHPSNGYKRNTMQRMTHVCRQQPQARHFKYD